MDEIYKICINDKEFFSIGSYMDNNDGIDYYYPKSNDIEGWKGFFQKESLLIKLWVIGNINYKLEEQNLDLIFPKELENFIKNNKKILNNFVQKYFIDEGIILNNYFEDFIFGRFSQYGDSELIEDGSLSDELLPTELLLKLDDSSYTIKIVPENEGETLDYSDLADLVFVEQDMYSTLTKDIEEISIKLFH
jgi:hypothetical protein